MGLLVAWNGDVWVPHDGERDCRSAYPREPKWWCPACLARQLLDQEDDVRAQIRCLTVSVPRERMVLLHAWADSTDDGTISQGYGCHEVLGIETMLRNGQVDRVPQIVLDGLLVNADEAMARYWPASSGWAVFVAHWPRDCDEKMLGDQAQVLVDHASDLERQRQQGRGRPAEHDPERNGVAGPVAPEAEGQDNGPATG
jgi:hypothetical protein